MLLPLPLAPKPVSATLRSLAVPFAAAMLAATPAQAQPRHDAQVWHQTVAQGPIADDLVYFLELQPRFGNDASELSQMLLRGAAGVKLSDRVSVYQGYANVRTRPANGLETREHRSFQQVNWSLGKPGGVALSSRSRLEQRWLSTGDDTGWRLRQMVRAAVPVKKGSKVALLGWVEGFVALNDTDWGARGGLDRVRSFAGLELPLSGKSTVETGYLNQYVKTPVGRDQMDHVFAVNLMLRP